MDPFLIEIRPGENVVEDSFSHKGEEFNFIMEGKVELNYNDNIYIFEAGDCFYLNSSIKHRLKALDGKSVYLLSVNAARADNNNS